MAAGRGAAGGIGAPSPFRRLRTANAALYRPGTAAAAVAAYRVLESAVERRTAQTAAALDAARRAVAERAAPPAPAPATEVDPGEAASPSSPARRRWVVGASLLVLLLLGVVALVTARPAPPRPRPAAAVVVASAVLVPPAEASVLVTSAMAAATAPVPSGGARLLTGERARFFNDVDASGDRLAGTRIGTDARALGAVDGGPLPAGQRSVRGVRLAVGQPSPSVLVVGITQARAAAWSAVVVVDSGPGGRRRTELRIAGSPSAGLLQFATVPLPAEVTAVHLTLTGRAPLVWQTAARR